jgi:PAS domain S-box-containing protein
MQPTSAPSSPSNEQAFKAIFEQSALGMAFIRLADARWMNVNRAFCQLLWQSSDDLLASSSVDVTHLDDVERELALFERMARGDLDACSVEKRFFHKKGHVVWAKVTYSAARDGAGAPQYASVIVEDIQDRKHALDELAESRAQLEAERARLQAIVDTIPTGLIMLDANGAMTLENAEWKRTWAGNAVLNSVVDYDSYKGFKPDTGERIAAEDWPCAQSLKRGIQTRDVILDIERFNGARGTIVVSSAPLLDATGKIVGAVAANMDITELRAAQLKLVEADRRKDEFLAMLAHELRNPLAPITAAADVLRMRAHGDEKVNWASAVIARQAKHLSALVDDLLDVSRVARGLVQLDREIVDLTDVVAQALEQSRPLLDAKKHTLDVHNDARHMKVLGDRNRLVQAVANLLNNAAKYTPDGGRVAITTRHEGANAVVEVVDTGIGIDAALLPCVFDMFTQAHRAPDRTQGGLGIGLALVKTIARLHGGHVSARSDGLAMGSTFTISLPATSGTEEPF